MKRLERHISILFLAIIFLLPSCNSEREKTDRQMDIAGSIIEAYPDSALVLLDSIENPSQLNKSRYNRYMLLLLQAKDKSYQDITSDTAIFATKQYYIDKNDIPNAALAAYYCGRVKSEQKNDTGAVSQYVEAERYATRISDINLKALIQSAIGAALSRQMLPAQALPYFKRAVKYFHQAGNRKNEMISHQSVGDCYLVNELPDSALIRFNEALQIAQEIGDSANIADIKRNIGILYKEVVYNNEAAKKHFFEALHYAKNDQYSYTCFKLADIYSMESKTDSAAWYLQESVSHLRDRKNWYLMANFYFASTSIKERQQNYKGALEDYKAYTDYTDSIFEQAKDAALIGIEKKYKLEQLQKANISLASEKQKILFYSAIGAFFSLLVILFFYRKNALSKRRELEAEQKVYHFMNMAETFDEKEQSFRSVLLRQFDIVKKTATLSSYIRKEDEKSNKLLKKFNEIVYGKEGLNWEVLYETLNDLQNGFFERLRDKFSTLNEDEFRICCLTCADFSREEIGIIMDLSVSTVQSKRNTIRKKLSIPSAGSIKNFLIQEVPST